MLSVARAPAVDCPFEALRAREFSRLDEQGITYLDYAASALYGRSQVEAHADRLRRGVFGNPHSEHSASRASETLLDQARAATLRFLDADPADYDVVFTANASAAAKLVGEAYPFAPQRGLTLAADNHNSIVGLREFARRAQASVMVLPLGEDLRLQEPFARLSDGARSSAPGLLALPYRSNFSGVAHPLVLVTHAQGLGFNVLLDAAGLGAAGDPSLRMYPADFVTLSFYKLFGLPTGVGALVARKEALAQLRRPWFAGGGVAYVSLEHDRHRMLPGHAGFEDGTPDFLAAGAIVDGFAFLEKVNRAALAKRSIEMTASLRHRLGALRHPDGSPAIRLYGPEDAGGTVISFNVIDSAGEVAPYSKLEHQAATLGLALRGGCFCNPGAAEAAFRLREHKLNDCFDALGASFSLAALQRCAPSATIGALRLSLGLPTVAAETERAFEILASCLH